MQLPSQGFRYLYSTALEMSFWLFSIGCVKNNFNGLVIHSDCMDINLFSCNRPKCLSPSNFGTRNTLKFFRLWFIWW
jgi:hypothetical protein